MKTIKLYDTINIPIEHLSKFLNETSKDCEDISVVTAMPGVTTLQQPVVILVFCMTFKDEMQKAAFDAKYPPEKPKPNLKMFN